MYHFEYATRKTWSPFRIEVDGIVRKMQGDLRSCFTFQYRLIGSASRNMVTQDLKSNKGFDLDYNLIIYDPARKYSPKELRDKLRNSLDKFSGKYGFDFAEDSTRALTIKVKDRKNSRIIHSVDFAIVKEYKDDDGNIREQYVRFNKLQNTYSWEKQPDSYYELPDKIEFCKRNGVWNSEVKPLYLDKKNQNTNHEKKSRSLFAETIHEVCQRCGRL